VTVTAVMGFSSGASPNACENLTPGHNNPANQAVGNVPFIVNISSLYDGYEGGESYTSKYLLILVDKI